ncbi:arylacetamide deacetylase-like 4 isoform X2 [Eublepharis macularius]|uniref:Arylacetamide deacetylase-like 4 isoform X2 n=1 Tax=Eublepharis macularius TaxID=481883 RepID=A0AA97KL45_EUBMA|nr:arylacetamide deacetylase-like 4 isoform X2 [Eublepharis macularius]
MEGMDFLWLLLVTGANLWGISVVLFLLWAAHYHWSHIELPHGICHPRKLSFLHFLLVVSFGMNHILRKVGLCKQFTILRLMMDASAKPVFRDPKLTIENVYIKAAYEKVCRHLAKETDSVVFAIEYGLVPENPYPLHFQQCLDVTIHLLEHAGDYGADPARIILCGDSFGGLITTVTCQALVQRKDIPKPRAQILLYTPVQFVKFSLPSYRQNCFIPLLLRRQFVTFGAQYFNRDVLIADVLLEGSYVTEDMKTKYKKWLSADNIPKEFRKRESKVPVPAPRFADIHNIIRILLDTKFSPLFADDDVIRQLPETFILTCEYDILRDDGILYKRRLEENGVRVTWHHLVDGFHAALFFIDNWFFSFPCTKIGMDHVVNFIRGL